jgi:hypothetical protein
MHGQTHAKFGDVMFGLESVQETIAFIADERHACFKNESKVKEDFVVPALLCGMGTGKSTMLENHLKTLKNSCSDPDLKSLLNNQPLVLNVTFNSVMTFNQLERKEPALLCLARRMISSYFGISWHEVSTLKLNSEPDIVSSILKLLVEHHKKHCKLHSCAQIAVIINVDEFNTITQTLALQNDEATLFVGEIAKVLRELSMIGVSNRCPVIPIIAGTAERQFVAATAGSGVQSVKLNLPVLSNSDMYEALRACNVDEMYFNNRDFIRLLSDTGGIPRVVRHVLEGLTEKYDASRIPIARAHAEAYIMSKLEAIPLNVVEALLPIILMGETVDINSPVFRNSLIKYDDLQRQGVVWMIKAGETNTGKYRVIVPMMSLKLICNQHSLNDVGVGRVSHMLSLLERRDWDQFEDFIGHYHSFLNRTLALNRSSVSLGVYYKGVKMHPDVAVIELKLDGKKDYEPLPRLAGKEEHRFPLTGKSAGKRKSQRFAESLTSKLLHGKVVVNSDGAPIDVLQVDPLKSGGILVRAICLLHTDAKILLCENKVHADRDKAIQALKNCEQLVAANNGTLPKCVTVHITNADLHEDVVPERSNSIVIGRHNMEAFFGPVLSFGMMSHTHLHPDLNGKVGKKKGFCTLRRLPTMHLSMRIAVQSLTLVARLISK